MTNDTVTLARLLGCADALFEMLDGRSKFGLRITPTQTLEGLRAAFAEAGANVDNVGNDQARADR